MNISDVSKLLQDSGFSVRHETESFLLAGRPAEFGVTDPFTLERHDEADGWMLRVAGPGQLSTERKFAALVDAVDYIVKHLLRGQ